LSKASKIIVQDELQKNKLKKVGYNKKNIELIYPFVSLNQFKYQKAKNKNFSILFASNPKDVKKFKDRGIYFLLECAKKLEKEVLFNFTWRTKSYYKVKQLIEKNKIKNINISNQIIKDMNKEFGKVHCTIIPYARYGSFVKLIPNSAIESLAAGKPVLCSSKTGIAKIIKKEKCGVVFEPNLMDFSKALKELKRNYSKYQKKCRKTAEKYFSMKKFLKKYEEIYNKLM